SRFLAARATAAVSRPPLQLTLRRPAGELGGRSSPPRRPDDHAQSCRGPARGAPRAPALPAHLPKRRPHGQRATGAAPGGRVHGITAGTDTGSFPFAVVYGAAIALVVTLTTRRVLRTAAPRGVPNQQV